MQIDRNLYWTILIVLCGVLAILVVRLVRSANKPDTASTHIRSGSVTTMFSLGVGLLFSILVGVIVWVLMLKITGVVLKKDTAVVIMIRHLMGVIAGGYVGYHVFLFGRTARHGKPIDINPGQKAYLEFLGVPFGNLGPGWGWILPFWMDYKIVDTAAMQSVSEGPEEFLTANGVEVFVESEATVEVFDPMKAQGIVRAEMAAYVDARRKSAVRQLVGKYRIPIDLAFVEKPTVEQQLQLFEKLVQIKGEISTSGPPDVWTTMNEELQDYGMKVTQVQFEKILFSDKLEKSIERTFNEIAEGPGLQKDMLNKTAQIQTFVQETTRDMGIELSDLTREEKMDLLKRAQAYVLAAEGQGGYQYHDFGQTPPRGVLINASTNQPTRGNNS